MDCSLPGSSVHGILQAIILEWVAISFSRGSSQTLSYLQQTGIKPVSPISNNCKSDTVVCYISQRHFKRKQNALLKKFFSRASSGHTTQRTSGYWQLLCDSWRRNHQAQYHWPLRGKNKGIPSPNWTRSCPGPCKFFENYKIPTSFLESFEDCLFQGQEFSLLARGLGSPFAELWFSWVQSLSILWFRLETSPLPDPPACSVEKALSSLTLNKAIGVLRCTAVHYWPGDLCVGSFVSEEVLHFLFEYSVIPLWPLTHLLGECWGGWREHVTQQRAECQRSMLRTKEGRQGRFLNTTGSWESFSKLPESLLNIHSVLRAGKACEWNKD